MLSEVQIGVFAGWIIVTVQCFVIWVKHRKYRYLTIAPLSLSVYGMVFYAAIMLRVISVGSQVAIDASSIGRAIEVIFLMAALTLLIRNNRE